jgi:predicted phage terminase large subunit-like protein
MNAHVDLTSLLKRKRKALKARDDLISFLEFVRPTPDAPDDVDQSLYLPAKHHRAVAAALERVAAGTIKRLIITLPPRHGKTTLASHGFPAWFAGKYPEKSMILATYNEKFSWDFGRQVREIMNSPQYLQIFPNTILKGSAQSVDRLEVEGGGALFFAGRGSSVTGRGGDVLLLDDPIKDRKEADSPTIRDACWLWFKQVLTTRLMTQSGAIVICMTRWHEDDIVGRLVDPHSVYYNYDEASQWKIIDLPAIAGDSCPLGRKRGEALWPERFDVEFLDIQRRSDPRGFQALYQGNPTPEDGAFFHTSHMRTYHRMQDVPDKSEMRFYGCSDHAVSLAQDRDRTCLMIVGVDHDDNIWVMPDCYWARATTDIVVEQMLVLMEKYKPQFWWAERGQISKSIGPFLRKRMIEKRVYVSMDEMNPIADKQQRAQAIQGRMAMGKVYFPGFVRWWADAHNEMIKFPQAAHDDFVDTLAYVGLGLQKIAPRRRAQVKDVGPKYGTLGWVKKEAKRESFYQMISKQTGGW